MPTTPVQNFPSHAVGAAPSTPELPENSKGRSSKRAGNVSIPQQSMSIASKEDRDKSKSEARQELKMFNIRHEIVLNACSAMLETKEFKEIEEKKAVLKNELNNITEKEKDITTNSDLPDEVKQIRLEAISQKSGELLLKIIQTNQFLLKDLERYRINLSKHVESAGVKSVIAKLNKAIELNTGGSKKLQELKELEEFRQLRTDHLAKVREIQNELNHLDAQKIMWNVWARLNDRTFSENQFENLDAEIADQEAIVKDIEKASNLLLTLDGDYELHTPFGNDESTDTFRLTTLVWECKQREDLDVLLAQRETMRSEEKDGFPSATRLPMSVVLSDETNAHLFDWWHGVKNEVMPKLHRQFDETNYFISREDILLKEYVYLEKDVILSTFGAEHREIRTKTRIQRGVIARNTRLKMMSFLGEIPGHMSKKCTQYLDKDTSFYLDSISENINALHPLMKSSFVKAARALLDNDLKACHTAYADLFPFLQKSEDAGEYIRYCLDGVNDALEKLEKDPDSSEEDHRLMKLLTEVLENLSLEFGDLARLVRQTLGQLIQNGVNPHEAVLQPLPLEHQDGLNKINWSLLKKEDAKEDAEINNLLSPAAAGSVRLSSRSAGSSTSRKSRKKTGKKAKPKQPSVAPVTAEASKESALSPEIDSLQPSGAQHSSITLTEPSLPEQPEDIEANQKEAETIHEDVKVSVGEIETALEAEVKKADKIIALLEEKKADVFKEEGKRSYTSPDGVRMHYESAIEKKNKQIRQLHTALKKIDKLKSADSKVLQTRTAITVLLLEHQGKLKELKAELIGKTATAHTLSPKERMFQFLEEHQLIQSTQLTIPDKALGLGDWLHEWVATLKSGEGCRYHLKYNEKHPADDTKFTFSSLKRMDQQFETKTLLAEQGRTDEYLFRGTVEGQEILEILKKYKVDPAQAGAVETAPRRRRA